MRQTLCFLAAALLSAASTGCDSGRVRWECECFGNQLEFCSTEHPSVTDLVRGETATSGCCTETDTACECRNDEEGCLCGEGGDPCLPPP